MSASAMIEKMTVAVKNAHTAISVLKKENEELTEENKRMKVRLKELEALVLRYQMEPTATSQLPSNVSDPIRPKPFESHLDNVSHDIR